MKSNPKGRTLQAYPLTWLSLRTPHDGSELAGFVRAALDARTVIDVTASPGLFGGLIGREETLTMACGGREVERSPDAGSAANLVQAHIIECLCGLGREHLDFYFLVVRDGLHPFQIEGALSALEGARKEGHIGCVGVAVAGSSDSARKAFLSDSLFEAALVHPSQDDAELRPLVEARSGLVVNANTGIPPILVPVASAADIFAAIRLLEPV